MKCRAGKSVACYFWTQSRHCIGPSPGSKGQEGGRENERGSIRGRLGEGGLERERGIKKQRKKQRKKDRNRDSNKEGRIERQKERQNDRRTERQKESRNKDRKKTQKANQARFMTIRDILQHLATPCDAYDNFHCFLHLTKTSQNTHKTP